MKPEEARPHYEALYTAYQRLEDVILEDLKAQIRPDDLTHVHDDPGGRASAFNEGARMVWLHIQKRRSLTPTAIETLIAQHRGQNG
tara:strand:+ start:5104 stop:5361 length:258 start_codon:yes stop_codon:yes gene_type:complete